jgi:hypothetical protein
MKKLFGILALSFLLVPAFTQSAAMLSQIMGEKAATVMDFSYLITSELGMDCTRFEAYTYCDRFGLFAIDEMAKEPVTVQTVSYFLMTNYGLKGGIMWDLTKSPRYAWKELKSTGFWKKGTNPDDVLSGRDLVRVVSKFFQTYPDAKLCNPPTKEASSRYIEALLSNKENEL